MIPQTAAGRRQLILDILGHRSVRSQGELQEILSREGFDITQATQAITITSSAPTPGVYGTSYTNTATGGGSGNAVSPSGRGRPR